MGEIIANFKGVVDRANFEAGPYTFKIDDAKQDHGPGGVYVKLKLQFTEGKYAGLFTEEIVSFADKALWRAKQFLKSLGYEVPDGPLRIDTADLIGLTFKAQTSREVDETGKYPPRLRVVSYHHVSENLAPESPETAHPAASVPSDPPKGDGNSAPPPPKEAAVPPPPIAKPKITV